MSPLLAAALTGWLATLAITAALGARLHRAQLDTLTSLPARANWSARSRRPLRRRPHTTTLAMFDLQKFKQINDRHGHAAGDQTLRVIARRVRELLPRQALLGRLGGDEFVILDLPPATLPQLLTAIAEPIDLPTATVSVGASLGLVYLEDLDPGSRDLSRALHVADTLMYDAKRHGGGWRTSRPDSLHAAPRPRPHKRTRDVTPARQHRTNGASAWTSTHASPTSCARRTARLPKPTGRRAAT